MSDKSEEDTKTPAKAGRPAKRVKVYVRNKVAFEDISKVGEIVNVWGNDFVVQENGALLGELHPAVAKEGIEIKRYVKAD